MSVERKLDVTAIKSEAIRKQAVQEILKQMDLINEDDLAEIIERATFTGKLDPSAVKHYDSLKERIKKLEIEPIFIVAEPKAKLEDWFIKGIPVLDNLVLRFDNKVYKLDAKIVNAISKDLNIKLQTANTVKS